LEVKRLLYLFLLAAHSGLALTIHVAPDGNDAWSGQLPHRDGTNGPKASVAAALAIVRNVRPSGLRERVEIQLRGGTYWLEAPILITPADSGASAQAPLVITAYRDERPVLSGGRQITLRKASNDLWQAKVDPPFFRSLFVGKRAQRARTPNTGFFRIQGSSPQDSPVKLKFAPGDIRPSWVQAGNVEVVALLAWADFRYFIRAVDEQNHVATLSGNPRPSNKENNARYYIENAPDALDTANEWYLNATNNTLGFIAAPGDDPGRSEVIAGRLDDLVVFQGEKERPIQHVVLRGLTFSHTDWDSGANGYADTQAAIAVRGDVRAEFASDCAIEDCTFAHLAGYAIELGRGCQRWRVVGNHMTDLGGGGIRVGETIKRTDAADANHSHIVTDNHIHAIGRVYPPAVGVFILQSGTNRVAHNHIHDTYYTAVSVGWNWGYQETPCRENIIEFNHMHDIGQAMLSDMGAVYTLGIQRGTVVRNNVIHDVNSFTYGGWGLYPDEGSSYIVWENNVVYRTKSAGFHQHYGRENIVRNNIFAFGREHQIMRTREEDHISFIFTNNIVCFDSGTLLGSNWKNDKFVMDHNLYFDERSRTSSNAITFAGASWEAWRKRGHDKHSLIEDPLFDRRNPKSLALMPGSPAFPLGFKPIDLSSVGVRRKFARDQ
jgi:hypothetical protein